MVNLSIFETVESSFFQQRDMLLPVAHPCQMLSQVDGGWNRALRPTKEPDHPVHKLYPPGCSGRAVDPPGVGP